MSAIEIDKINKGLKIGICGDFVPFHSSADRCEDMRVDLRASDILCANKSTGLNQHGKRYGPRALIECRPSWSPAAELD